MSKRVQIPAYADAWMQGDRYGALVKVTPKRPRRKTFVEREEIAHVLLDKSGRTLRFILADCQEVE